jgi:hypothetical protein
MIDSGERHFYSATSNLNLTRGGKLLVIYANRSNKGQKGQACLDAADINEELSYKLKDYLIQLFFT